MKKDRFRIAQIGSFDFENYGDLLFYDILCYEIKKYLPNIEVVPFSPVGGNKPFSENVVIYPVREIERQHKDKPFDCIVVGGGDIIRLDNTVLSDAAMYDDYGKAADLWALPIIISIKYNIPIVFNAPGVPNIFTKTQEMFVKYLLSQVSYINVREATSRDKILRIAPNLQVEIVPDTAFLISDVYNLELRDRVFENLKEEFNLPDHYIVYQQMGRFNTGIQDCEVGELLHQIEEQIGEKILLLPIGYVQDDDKILYRINEACKFSFLMANRKLSPIEIYSLIGHAKCFIGTSFHGCISAHNQGIPAVGIDCANRNKMYGYFQDMGLLECYCKSLRQVTPNMLKLKVPEEILKKKREKVNKHFHKIAQIIQDGIIHSEAFLPSAVELLSKVQNTQKDIGIVRSMIFFDLGKGFSSEGVFETSSNNSEILIKVKIPVDCTYFRFDPANGQYCALADLKIQAGLDFLEYQILDGMEVSNFIIFNTNYPQILVKASNMREREVLISAQIIIFESAEERAFAGLIKNYKSKIDELQKNEDKRQNIDYLKYLEEIQKAQFDLQEIEKKEQKILIEGLKRIYDRRKTITRQNRMLEHYKNQLVTMEKVLQTKQREVQREHQNAIEQLNNNKILLDENMALTLQKRELETRCQWYVDSTSWKITAPMRRFKDFWLRKNYKDRVNNEVENVGTSAELDSIVESNDIVDKKPSKVFYIPESITGEREDIDSLIEKLKQYDVISFDIFDTLILRYCSEPTVLFRIMALDMGIENFESLRIDAEKEARRYSKNRNGEISILDIYKNLHAYLGIDVREGIEREIEYEKLICFANPYMQEVYNKLQMMGKRIIIISDMYIDKKHMESILEKCGYVGYEQIYISCDYGAGKGEGELQEIAMRDLRLDERSFIHIGDNYRSDIEGSQKVGWATYYYENCNKRGEKFRPKGFSSITGSIYKGITNSVLYNGSGHYNEAYEHGFLYGGLLVCGFCQWLNQYSREHEIDKILFLARDADIISKVYNLYYKEVDNEYVVISRLAVWKLVFEQQTEEFIKFFILSQAQSGECSFAEVLHDNGLECIIPILENKGIDLNQCLTSENYVQMRKIIYEYKQDIVDSFADSVQAGKQYFTQIIGKAQNICVVDLGWSAQILVYLKQFINKNISKEIKVTGAYMAATSNLQTNSYIESGLLETFLFSYAKNESKILRTNTPVGHTIATLMEAMFTSTQNTLLEYYLKDDKTTGFRYGFDAKNEALVEEIQKGIIDFAAFYANNAKKITQKLSLTAIDAYAPFESIKEDFPYFNKIFGDVQEFSGVPRYCGNRDVTTIGDMLRERNLIS